MSVRRIFKAPFLSGRNYSFTVLTTGKRCRLCCNQNACSRFEYSVRFQSSASVAVRPVERHPEKDSNELTQILMQCVSQKRTRKPTLWNSFVSAPYSKAISSTSLADVLTSMAKGCSLDQLTGAEMGVSKLPSSSIQRTMPLSESLKVDSIRLDMQELNELGQYLYWNLDQIDEALKILKRMVKNFQSLQDGSEQKKELTEAVTGCRKLVGTRICANCSADVYLMMISDRKKIATVFDDSSLELFRDFVLQFEALELNEGFKMSRLSLLLSKFFNLLEKEASFVNLSPQMIELIENSSINERVSLLDDMARISCRSLTLLSTICTSLAKEENLSRAKLRSVCFSLSQLNFYNEELLTRAADSFICEVRETAAITPQMAASFLSLCRKMRFKNDLVVNTVATCMIPLLHRLKEDASHDIQKEQDLKSFAEFITSIASLNAQIYELQFVPESYSDTTPLETTNSLQELITECVNKHFNSIDNLAFFKSLTLLGLLTDEMFSSVAAKLEKVIRIEEELDSNDSFAEFELFCAHLVLAEGCLLKLPSALQLRRKLQEPMKDLVTLKQSRVVLSDADMHVRQFLEDASTKLGLEFVASGHIGLGYVADCIKIPADLRAKIGAKQIVADCPSLSDSVNMFEALRGEKLKQLRHLKKLNSLLFIVDPLHWEQLTTSDEKMQYLEAKFSIEFEQILKPHFEKFDFNVVQ